MEGNKNWNTMGVTSMNPEVQFKNCAWSYDQWSHDWYGNKFDEKIITLIRYQGEKELSEEHKVVMSRGYKDFEQLMSEYVSLRFGLDKEELQKQVRSSKHVHIKNSNGEVYITTTDPSPLITEFWVSKLMRFMKPEYSEDEVFNKIDSALELLAE